MRCNSISKSEYLQLATWFKQQTETTVFRAKKSRQFFLCTAKKPQTRIWKAIWIDTIIAFLPLLLHSVYPIKLFFAVYCCLTGRHRTYIQRFQHITHALHSNILEVYEKNTHCSNRTKLQWKIPMTNSCSSWANEKNSIHD